MSLALAAVACGPHEGVDPQPGTRTATQIGIAPFRYIVTTDGRERELLRLDADGTLFGPHGEKLAQVSDHTITRPSGEALAWVGDDDSVALAGVPPGSSFDREMRPTERVPGWFLQTPTVKIQLGGDLISENKATPLIFTPDGRRLVVSGYFVGADIGNTRVAELVIAMLWFKTLVPPPSTAAVAPPQQ